MKLNLRYVAVLAALAAGNAAAYTAENDNGDSLTFHGRFEARYQDNGGDSEPVVNSGSSRFGVLAKKNLANDWTGIAHAEWGFNSGASGTDIYDRLLYSGLEHDTYGKILVGTKQWGVIYDVAWFADLGRTYGSRGAGYYNLSDWGISSGHGRAANSITYRNSITDNLKFGLQYQTTRTDVGLDAGSGTMTLKNGIGASLSYKLNDIISLGVAYNQNDIHDIDHGLNATPIDRGAKDGDTSRFGLVGMNIAKDGFYLGLTHSHGDKAEVTTGGEFIRHHGTEMYTHYHFDNNLRLTFNINHLADKDSDYHRTTYSPGAEYHFDYNNFFVWAEYNINESQDNYNADTGLYEGRDNAFSMGIRYNF